MAHRRVLKIDPSPGPATLLGIGPASQDLIGGHTRRAAVALAHTGAGRRGALLA
jgi:hypothetical protein